MASANLVEIFSSVQGEGPEVGRSTLFVRFGGCDLRCQWCDSPHTWKPSSVCRIEDGRGSNQFTEIPNPVNLERIVSAANDLEVEGHRAVSLTGGEPLLQAKAAAEVAKTLRRRGPDILLETHGVHYRELPLLLPHIDIVSMDWKLPGEVRRAVELSDQLGSSFDEDHGHFLEIAREAPKLVVKLVITQTSRDDEINTALITVARIAPNATVVLQPVTPSGAIKGRPTAARMLFLARHAESVVDDVRVIPQTHPIYGAP